MPTLELNQAGSRDCFDVLRVLLGRGFGVGHADLARCFFSYWESVTFRGGSGRDGLFGWVPSLDVVVELVVENTGANLKEPMRSGGCPAHLLFLYHPFRDDLILGVAVSSGRNRAVRPGPTIWLCGWRRWGSSFSGPGPGLRRCAVAQRGGPVAVFLIFFGWLSILGCLTRHGGVGECRRF